MTTSPLSALLLSAFLLAGAVSCSTTSARMKRIDTNPDIYANLTEEERALVQAGEIREGFAKEAVFLAWGRPNDIRRGSREGALYETWIYLASEPDWDPYFSLGYGYGYWAPYGHGRHYHRPYFGFSPVYRGTRRIYLGRVEFQNDRIVSWETAR